jgi:hypothetical protein
VRRGTAAWTGAYALLAALTLAGAPALVRMPLAWAVLVVGVGAVIAPAAPMLITVVLSLTTDALVATVLAALGVLQAETALGGLAVVMAAAVALRWRTAPIRIDPAERVSAQ